MREKLKKIEKKWQKRWEEAKLFEADVEPEKKKFFVTFPYPYVNGAPHIGAGFTAFRVDVYARYKRMQGFNVLYPQGFHATGEPIVGAVERLKQGDKVQINTFKAYGASTKDLQDFIKKGPEFVAKYWMQKWIEDLKLAGFSIDWRRTFITTPMTPTYSRFIEWQYNTLRDRGYVIQGTHPVIWCPNCQSPTGDHDRLEGEGASPVDYVVIKFELDSDILPCATLRPETTYGVTNIWINPSVEYVRANVNGERWIISKQAAEKLKDQLKDVEVLGKIKGSELVGKYCRNPVTGDRIIILPAAFCDPDTATGIVMSVPSHAPYDWIALHDLQEQPEQLKKYKDYSTIVDELKRIKPISLISTEGFGEHPAIEVCEQMKISSQKDVAKLEDATSLVYKKEFHTGVLNDRCGDYAGMKVSECKEKLTEKFVESGIADIMWECTAPVVCRCTTKCYVKILENQWFLKFSDKEWKKKVKKCLQKMKLYPEDVRMQFENTIDWLKDKACTRKTGLGTPLPWDKEWKIETLSDSVIYMAYYTIARVINERSIPAEKLTDEVFDYVFFGKGDAKELEAATGLDAKIIEEMRTEFEYFYPVDLRNSGKDLVQNHLTFFLFHHVAMWDEKYWPKAIGVNGYVNISGIKMSKSKGNVVPLRELVKEYSADLVRINIVTSNEGLDDAEWKDESIATYESRFGFLLELIDAVKKMRVKKTRSIDLYLQSKLQQHINAATEYFEQMRFRSAIQSALFAATNDIKWYIERVGGIEGCDKKTMKETLSAIIRMIAPLAPHIAEEMWKKLGGKGFVAVAAWPEADDAKVDKNALELEEIVMRCVEDLKHVIKIVGKKDKAYIYVASPKEFVCFNEAKDFLRKRFGLKELNVFKASEATYDPEGKAKKAKYGKPGIYLE